MLYKQLHWHDIVTIYLQICILYTCRNVSYCTRFWNIKTKPKTHIHKHFSRRKCKHVFAINHDRYYSTVNCQSLEFHILHIQNFLRGYNIDIKIRSVVLRCIIKVELLSLSHDMAESDSHQLQFKTTWRGLRNVSSQSFMIGFIWFQTYYILFDIFDEEIY